METLLTAARTLLHLRHDVFSHTVLLHQSLLRCRPGNITSFTTPTPKISEDKFPCADGSFITVPRKKLKLQEGAYPTIFENLPSYLTKQLPQKRKDPSQRLATVIARDKQQFEEWNERDNIIEYQEFKSQVSNRNISPFIFIDKEDYVLLCKIEDNCFTEVPKVAVSIKVSSAQKVQVFHNNMSLPNSKFHWCLGHEGMCDKWSKFDCLLSHLKSFKFEDMDTKEKLSVLSSCFQNIDVDTFEQKSQNKLKFLQEQLELALTTQPRYSSQTLVWASTFFYSFPGAYHFVQSSKMLTLLHPSYLRRLLCTMGTNNSGINSSQVSYLREKCKLLEEHEKIVTIMLDEIYVTPKLSYKGGKIEGLAVNEGKELDIASTIQVFMISSPLSSNADVIALFPVKNLTSVSLYNMTCEVLNVLENCGYISLCLISDNNRVNKGMFQHMCGGSLKTSVKNPANNERDLFLLFDSVHLLKCIRNNWLNTQSQIFHIPEIDHLLSVVPAGWITEPSSECPTSSISCTYFTKEARFNDLIKLYESEQSSLIKEAPALTRKALYPSSFEKQNVSLALKVFNEKNIVALERKKAEICCSDGTINFIKLILRWWKVVNVKNPFKGKHLRDSDCDPIQGPEDPKVRFLEQFLLFLKVWQSSAINGKLSNDTHTALAHTIESLIYMCKYIFHELKWKYVLLGKFQTDKLEGRFGQYRQMSGGNYNVSAEQVLESERKLKLCTVLRMKSASLGELSITPFVSACSDMNTRAVQTVPDSVLNKFDGALEHLHTVEIDRSTQEILICIGGYVAHSVLNSLGSNTEKCVSCVSTLSTARDLIIENNTKFSYFDALNRGGLKCPSDFVVSLCTLVYKLFNILLSETFENDFLQLNCQRKLVINLTMAVFELNTTDFDVMCKCEMTLRKLAVKCTKVLANIFINNYCKVQNEKQALKDKNKTHRKCSKFKK
ncbi:hypothetical protein ANN_13401 [Periplaneta americana]|uniref:Transposable element P transposase-like RNase H domain-containing protein n=1 Tax=Periplaneta americana TaxID=6978 RepID=A0ABQ8TLE0_PERAM|nr:hypothetical protein ANN_13401 [Periplaneta americana]